MFVFFATVCRIPLRAILKFFGGAEALLDIV